MKTLSKAISIIFHPIFAITYSIIITFLILGNIENMLDYKLLMTLIAFVLTAILPILLFMTLKFFNHITTMEMSDRRERTLPYILTAIIDAATIYTFEILNVPIVTTTTMYGSVAALLIIMLINLKWKISAHCTAWGGLTAFCIMQYITYPLPNLTILSTVAAIGGAVGTARIYLNAHTLAQTIAGYAVGTVTVTIFGIIGLLRLFY